MRITRPHNLGLYHGPRETVEFLLSAGADTCTQDQCGNTALM